MSINIEYWLISSELEQMERYLDLVHASIKDNQIKFDASIEEIAKTMSEEERSEFYEYHEDEFIEVNADFPRLLFSSFVVSWYSFIENHLLSFCKNREFKISISIQENENYGEGIKRAYNFIHKATGYQVDNVQWQELTQIGKIRNKIVHNKGQLSYSIADTCENSIPVKVYEDVTLYLDMDKDLYRYFKTYNLLEHRAGFHINPSLDYCKHLVTLGLEIFKKLTLDFKKEPKTQARRDVDISVKKTVLKA